MEGTKTGCWDEISNDGLEEVPIPKSMDQQQKEMAEERMLLDGEGSADQQDQMMGGTQMEEDEEEALLGKANHQEVGEVQHSEEGQQQQTNWEVFGQGQPRGPTMVESNSSAADQQLRLNPSPAISSSSISIGQSVQFGGGMDLAMLNKLKATNSKSTASSAGNMIRDSRAKLPAKPRMEAMSCDTVANSENTVAKRITVRTKRKSRADITTRRPRSGSRRSTSTISERRSDELTPSKKARPSIVPAEQALMSTMAEQETVGGGNEVSEKANFEKKLEKKNAGGGRKEDQNSNDDGYGEEEEFDGEEDGEIADDGDGEDEADGAGKISADDDEEEDGNEDEKRFYEFVEEFKGRKGQNLGMQMAKTPMKTQQEHCGKVRATSQNGEVVKTTLFVCPIPASLDEATFKQHFVQFGQIRSAILARDPVTGKNRGFGFISFFDAYSAAVAHASKIWPKGAESALSLSWYRQKQSTIEWNRSNQANNGRKQRESIGGERQQQQDMTPRVVQKKKAPESGNWRKWTENREEREEQWSGGRKKEHFNYAGNFVGQNKSKAEFESSQLSAEWSPTERERVFFQNVPKTPNKYGTSKLTNNFVSQPNVAPIKTATQKAGGGACSTSPFSKEFFVDNSYNRQQQSAMNHHHRYAKQQCQQSGTNSTVDRQLQQSARRHSTEYIGPKAAAIRPLQIQQKIGTNINNNVYQQNRFESDRFGRPSRSHSLHRQSTHRNDRTPPRRAPHSPSSGGAGQIGSVIADQSRSRSLLKPARSNNYLSACPATVNDRRVENVCANWNAPKPGTSLATLKKTFDVDRSPSSDSEDDDQEVVFSQFVALCKKLKRAKSPYSRRNSWKKD